MQDTCFNMFCLPPAGCNANIYFPWKKQVSDDINIIPLEYPGHGTKLSQPFINHVDLLAEHLMNEMLVYSDTPFILFGHSLGGGLIWKILEKLQHHPMLQQLKLIMISSRPEHDYAQHLTQKHLLNDQDILQEIRKYNYLPDQVLNNPSLLQFCLKVIRHDFALSDQLIAEKIMQTSIPLMAFYGKDDPDIPNAIMMEAWQKHTTAWLGCEILSGNHFYFTEPKVLKQLLQHIQDIVQQHLMPPQSIL
ncbi:thioesterase II family protein [Acinetobacter shaoyimingii]|uniref:thioesterase II family protein n=1 Tax=Acinetobacter shaoyimingii TaxID=2715164 RepID=UPI0018C8B8AD|nr:alpha/beta fold hydrolase [Acinetobacter shaoyimingii]